MSLRVYDQRPIETKMDGIFNQTYDQVIGRARLEITPTLLRKSNGSWQSLSLPLNPGDMYIKIRWDPKVRSIRGFFAAQWNSAPACIVHGFANTFVAGCLCFVGQQADWLGTGHEAVRLPAACALMVFAGLSAYTAALLQMLGA